MRKAKFVTFIILMTYWVQAFADPQESLRVPILNMTGPETNDYYSDEIFEAPACDNLLSPVSDVINFANSKFQRREWSADFLNERFDVAKVYSDRSRYEKVRKRKGMLSKRSDPIVGTIGMTYARYDQSNFSNGNLESRSLDLIPEEKTLGLKPLPRPLDRSGKGIIFELRTYAKDKVLGRDAFSFLIYGALHMVFSMLVNYPELYDDPILYTYGDELSVRFYKQMGFEVVKSIAPIEHDGSKWWVLACTPRRLELVMAKFNLERGLEDINQPLPVQIPGGKTVLAAPDSFIYLGSRDIIPNTVTLNEETEILPGIFAAQGSVVNFPSHPTDWQFQISKTSRPVFDKKRNFWIAAGSAIEIDADFNIKGPFQFLESRVTH